ncbi:dihydrofolate reductase family protein [Acinetobacter colistiniresistens]|uniref:dihydrofolate reductase family protein n=1 Tax=Acinetobacter colistiniresistens TaxID=280145 RepID=UPI00211CB950|nr:dihydrofolate reductase family protein [Acinetobacter colistiniresistens]UUM26955.1 dihydrofolate reductase family protein [Acinetobacter colistiniresistens]
MKVQYFAASTLDGFIATEDDSLEWLFALGELDNSSYPTFIANVGALVMGSATYQWMLNNAEQVAAETGSSWPYSQPTWVFSSRKLPLIEGANIHFVQGKIAPVYAEIQSVIGDKNIWIVGGGELAGQFYDANLLDELIIQIGSVTLGKGKALFPRRLLAPTLKLISVHPMGEDMVELHYTVEHKTKLAEC